MDNKTFHSSGKLLVTGEYVVIDGAQALCLPTKKGQSLTIKYNQSQILSWKGLSPDGSEWLNVSIDLNSWNIISSSDLKHEEYLIFVLQSALELNPKSESLLTSGAEAITQLDFPTDWGLGSSSTFLCNVSKWLDVDPFKLHFKVSNGSGYDIAVGMENHALIYQVNGTVVSSRLVNYSPTFSEHIYFVHLNQKQVSSQEIESYTERKKKIPISEIAKVITNITNGIYKAETIERFEELILLHEELISHILERETIKNELFSGYSTGIVKSLGAWGGDFVLITTRQSADVEYFINKGFKTIIPYSEMIN